MPSRQGGRLVYVSALLDGTALEEDAKDRSQSRCGRLDERQ